MTDELSQAAERAWVAMLHDVRPMPAGVALDMAQDVCGDRDDAVSAILRAASDYLHGLIPDDRTFRPEAESICRAIAAEDFKFAETIHHNVLERSRAINWPSWDAVQAERAAAWLRWSAYVERDIALCRAVCAAAYPLEV